MYQNLNFHIDLVNTFKLILVLTLIKEPSYQVSCLLSLDLKVSEIYVIIVISDQWSADKRTFLSAGSNVKIVIYGNFGYPSKLHIFVGERDYKF